MRQLLIIRIALPAWLSRLGVGPVLSYRRLRFGVAYRRVPLTQGLYAKVDPADYRELARHEWHATRGRHTWYAQRKVWDAGAKREVTIKMHRVVLPVAPGYVVDHINRNGLDNRRANLRLATVAQNAWNAKKRNSRSGYKGVHYDKNKNRWRAAIVCNGQRTHLGYFKDKHQAAKAYDTAAKTLHGEFAALNFPKVVPTRMERPIKK